MDAFVVKKLEEWNMADLVEDFQAENITEESFKLIQYENLKEIIKKAGPRILFWSKFQKEFCMILPSTPNTEVESIYSNQSDKDIYSENISTPSRILQTSNLIPNTLNESFFTTLLEVPPLPCVSEYLKTFNGSVVKKFFEENGFLDNTHRSMLANLIISSELDKNQGGAAKISNERFKELTLQIIKIFPTECAEQYYSAYSKITKIPATGKLYDTYNYYKRKFKKIMNISKTESLANAVADTTIEEKLKFLKTNIEPWETVKLLWNECRSYRLNCNFTIQDYFDKFKCLTLTKGIELLLADFDVRYPEKINKLFCNWEVINEKLLSICKSKGKADLDHIIETHGGPLAGFAVLPYLLASSVYKTVPEKPESSKRKRYKLTQKEVQESFFIFVNDDYRRTY